MRKDTEELLVKIFDLIIEKDTYYGILEHFCNAFFWNLVEPEKSRANNFIEKYVIDNNEDTKKIEIIVDIIRYSCQDMFEKVLLIYISLNQNVEDFRHLAWRGNGTSGTGDVILADIEAADWIRILSIVENQT